VLDGVQIPHGKGNYKGDAVSCAKTAELIVMPFGLWTRVGLRKHVLDGAQSPRAKGQLLGEGHAQACLTTLCHELCKNG